MQKKKREKRAKNTNESDEEETDIETATIVSSIAATSARGSVRTGASNAGASTRTGASSRTGAASRNGAASQSNFTDMDNLPAAMSIDPTSDVMDSLEKSAAKLKVEAEMSEERFDLFRESLNLIRSYYKDERGDSPTVSFPEIMDKINNNINPPFNEKQVLNQLEIMSNENMALWWQPENNSVLFF